jgi:PAS domain S-box-containing protein
LIHIELTRGLRVLLVDDDEVDRMAVIRALRQLGAGVDVTEAESALAAIEFLRTELFDCVISDLDMPGHDGAWFMAQVKAQGVEVPFVVLTGQGDEQLAVALMKAGATDYVPKTTISASRLGHVLQHAIRVHRAECEAQRAQERLHLALGATGLGIWDIDLRTRELSCDPRCREIYGVAAEDTLSLEQALAAMHVEDHTLVRARAVQALDPASGGRYEGEHRVIGISDSVERWVHATGQVYFIESRPVRFVGTVQDVTTQKLEKTAAWHRLEFEQLLIGIVSHDLRNPISAMMMGAQIITAKAPPDSALTSTGARILSSGARAMRLIRDLLDFTQVRIGHGLPVDKQPCDIHAVCQQALDECGLSHPDRKIILEKHGPGEGLWDPDRIGQVIGNLTRNAVSYSPAATPITVRCIGSADRVELEVHNHNLGDPIAPDVLATLFQPFRRGEKKYDAARSVGLGLFIVREIVVTHGGAVYVHSTAEDGTTFRVELPRQS